LTTLLVPERALLLGLPVAICVFTQWRLALQEEEDSGEESVETPLAPASPLAPAPSATHPRRWTNETNQSRIRRMMAAGVVAGLLPLVHAHTFLAVMAVASCLALLFRRWLSWVVFFATAIGVAAPELVWLARGSLKANSFLGWHVGWESGTHDLFWFWFVNTG